MSDVKWCDLRQHAFTTAKEGWVHSQSASQNKGKTIVVDYDICAEHAPQQFGDAFDTGEDDLDRRLKAIETKQAADDRAELARYRKLYENAKADADQAYKALEAEYDSGPDIPPGTVAQPQPTGKHRGEGDDLAYP